MLIYLQCSKGQMKTSNKFKYSLSLLQWKLRESILEFIIDTLRCFLNEPCYFQTKPKMDYLGDCDCYLSSMKSIS